MEIQRRAGRLEQSKDRVEEELQFGKGLAGCLGLSEEGCSREGEEMCENHRRVGAGLSKPVKMEIHALFWYFHTFTFSPKVYTVCVTFTTSGVTYITYTSMVGAMEPLI